MKGIDVSNHQGNIDFAKVKADGVEIVIVKATEGRTYTDPYFEQNYTNAKNAGLLVGCYHFLRANDTDDEINNFLNSIKDKTFDAKVVIDMEADFGSVDINSKKTRDFADALIAKGYEVVLYTYEYFYNSKLNSSVKDLPLWIAKYADTKPNVPSYIGWQYGSNGHVNGITGYVDMNDFSDGILLDKCGQCQGGSGTSEPTVRDIAQNSLSEKVRQAKEFFKGDVLKLQKDLNRVMNTKIAEDNLFGTQTYGLILAFQKRYNLEVDGLMGNESIGKLNGLIAEMNKPKAQVNQRVLSYQKAFNKMGLGTIDEDGILGNQTLGSVSKLPLIQVGSNNAIVGWIQGAVGCSQDNSYGNITKSKVIAYQSANKLTADGICGKQTITFMLTH